MILQTNGHFGILTTTPSYPLDVSGAVNATEYRQAGSLYDLSLLSATAGTAANSKALILGASGEIATISSLTATNIYGTLQTAAQGNITSLGTLSGLTIGGNLTFTGASRIITGLSSISATTITGAVSGSRSGITAVGALSGLTIHGDLVFSGASGTISGLSSVSATTLSGTLSTASQTAITAIGTLSALTIAASGVIWCFTNYYWTECYHGYNIDWNPFYSISNGYNSYWDASSFYGFWYC